MSRDEYVQGIINKYKLPTGQSSPAYQASQQLNPIIKSWAGEHLREVSPSGSYAKDTAIRGSADIDLFVSLIPQTNGTLKEIYESLYRFLQGKGLNPRIQNVSIGISYNGLKIDVIPARKHEGNTNDHSLYKSKAQTWTQTNVQVHINTVNQSGRLDEIRAIKIWRNLRNLDFPSFYLELTVLNALYGAGRNQLSTNVFSVLKYLRDSFTDARVVDPANSNNIISDDLTQAEKSVIASRARESCSQQYWSNIIW
jgi:hypothetical protein